MLEADSALLDVYRAWGLVVRVEFEGNKPGMAIWAPAYSLHCSSFLWFNQVYLYVYIYIVSYQVTSTMETTGRMQGSDGSWARNREPKKRNAHRQGKDS